MFFGILFSKSLKIGLAADLMEALEICWLLERQAGSFC
jgi:hypothetical protein